MPEKINDKKFIALKAQFKEAKTAHIFQIKIREFCKERYDELINAGVPKDQCVEKIRNQLTNLR